MTALLDITRDGPFARVTLRRPEVRNAFNARLIDELRLAFESLAGEPATVLRGVVLAGEGTTFCAGADVTWMREARTMTIEDNERDAAAMQAMFTAIEACPVPVITRVQGAALGGGMGLCAASDIVVATRDATFGFTETKLGIVPAVISSFVVPKIGETHARALFLTGERFDAARAERIGLVHEVVSDLEALDGRIRSLLDELRTAGPTAVRRAKGLLREMVTRGVAEARPHMPRHIAEQRASDEGQEGLAAFLERRAPAWRG